MNDSVLELVRGVWTEVLETSAPVGPDDNFFGLGGDSLKIMMVLFKLGTSFGLELPAQSIVENPTLREFCAWLASQGVATGEPSADDLVEEGSI
jgi:acyl carrier protein